jgi:type IV pilus assembly protein PilQ
MSFKRLLTVGLMALFCAGTAMAASQLNSVKVTTTPDAATVSLLTTGSFVHKEYRADQHLLLVDLADVTAMESVERAASLDSALLKSYKLSSYTSASGNDVTRIELMLGDDVNVDVQEQADGLQIVLKGTQTAVAPAASSTGSAASASAVPAYAQPVKSTLSVTPQNPSAPETMQVQPDAAPTASAATTAASVQNSGSTPHATRNDAGATIRNVSVRRSDGSVDVIVDGPGEVHPFLLKQPDRLVLDFNSSAAKSAIKKIPVNSKDVLQVRVGRFQAAPPVTRIVVDLGGPREFDVVSSEKMVTVRIKSVNAVSMPPTPEVAPPSAKSNPVIAEAATPASPVVQSDTHVQPAPAAPPAPTPAPTAAATPAVTAGPVFPPASTVAAPAASPQSAPVVRESQVRETRERDSSVSETAAVMPPSQPAREVPPPAVQPAAPVVAMSAPATVPEPKGDPVAEVPRPAPSPIVPSVVNAAAAAAAAPRFEAAAETQRPALSSPAIQQLANPGASTTTSVAAPAPRYTGEPISVNLKDVDLKDFFRLIHEISGLNIVLDPNVRGSVTLVLDDVPWDQALDIVLKNNALDRELQGNVLRIAATDTLRKEAVDRRAQTEAVALAVERQTITRSLSYAKSKELVPTLKKFLSARGDVISDERTNTLIISDIPSVIPNLDRLISQLDRKSREVEIEVRVVSATRSFSRDLGVQLGLNWGNGVTTIAGSNPNGSNTSTASTTSSSSTSSTTSTTNTAATAVPLFTNFLATGASTGFSISNITKSYGIDAILTAAESHNLAKVLSRPRVVTQSNVKAEVKQGQKLPVYQASTANANASVSYIDAVLRLSVTPQITADNTIFLTVDVENTQPAGTINQNYILTTQQATTQVLVTNGGTVVIGGVIQTTNSVSTSQTPFLGNIPWLGNLFKERLVKTETDELIFFITPKIIET